MPHLNSNAQVNHLGEPVEGDRWLDLEERISGQMGEVEAVYGKSLMILVYMEMRRSSSPDKYTRLEHLPSHAE